jgi:hypothetical protein
MNFTLQKKKKKLLYIYKFVYMTTWKVLKCGAGGGWKRSVGLIM